VRNRSLWLVGGRLGGGGDCGGGGGGGGGRMWMFGCKVRVGGAGYLHWWMCVCWGDNGGM
jgi:hypothetical protein